MVFNALQINSYVCSEESKLAQMQKKNPFGRRKVNTLASAECELIIDHITGHPVETSGCGHATFGFGSAPATV